jgi:hypothetical protein
VTGPIHPTAAANWTLSGSMLTWAVPMVGFIVAATVLYLLFSRPHRIPGHSELVPSRAAPPDPGTAHAMAAAAGMTTAAGAGADPLAHEPAGAPEAAEAAAEDRPAGLHQPGTTIPEEPGELGAAAPVDPGDGARPQPGDDPAGPEAAG